MTGTRRLKFLLLFFPLFLVKTLSGADHKNSIVSIFRPIYPSSKTTPCPLDIRLYWAVKMLIFLATWAEITN
jgi:hypothetical protein